MIDAITRAQFDSLNCRYLRRLECSAGGALSATVVDQYVTADDRVVIHTYAMGGEDFVILDSWP